MIQQVLLCIACACTIGCTDALPTDAVPNPWQAAPPMPEARLEGVVVAAGGRLWYLGGITGTFGDQTSARASDRVDVFDPATGNWSAGPPLPDGAARHHLAVAAIGAQIWVLGGFTGIIGGADVAGKFTPNAQTWLLEDGKWQRKADQPVARGAATAQALGGRIYVVGGGPHEAEAVRDVWAYDPATDTWQQRAWLPTERQHLASCALGGKLLAVGGWLSPAKQAVDAAQLYDPQSDTWALLPDLPTARGGLGAATLTIDGLERCHVVGGERWHEPLPATFAAHEAFDLTSGTWQKLPPMPTRRHGLGVATLAGRLWTVGGGPVLGNSYTAAVETFAP